MLKTSVITGTSYVPHLTTILLDFSPELVLLHNVKHFYHMLACIMKYIYFRQ